MDDITDISTAIRDMHETVKKQFSNHDVNSGTINTSLEKIIDKLESIDKRLETIETNTK